MNIYIRPLKEEDALISYAWRNDPEIWRYTGARPDRLVTKEMEIEWARKVLQDASSRRFAVCLTETDEYIGNVQITNLFNGEGQFHIFIGNKKFWGLGIATKATELLVRYARDNSIRLLYLHVHRKNEAAIKAYCKNGFSAVSVDGEMVRMEKQL